MENKSHALAAGAFVLLATALLVALAVWLTRDTSLRTAYEISTREPVTGLQVQAPVRFRGIPVGKVTSIGFDSRIPGNVLIKISVDDATPLTDSSFATLAFQGVTGLSFVQLDDDGRSKALLKTPDEGLARIPLRPGLITKLTDQGASVMAQLEETTRRLNMLLAPQQQKQLMDAVAHIGLAAQNIAQLSSTLQEVAQAQLGPNKVNVPQLVQQATATLKSIEVSSAQARLALQDGGQAAAELTQVIKRMNQSAGTLDQIQQTLDNLNSAALPQLNQTLHDTARAARAVERATTAVSDNPQALIYGRGKTPPGPGEPGFSAPEVRP